MKYRKLGNSGLSVSELSFGSWISFGKQMDVEPVKSCLKTALDAGINFFDNAEVYASGQSELIMSEAFRQLGINRNEYILTSKYFWGIEDRLNFKNTLNRKYLTQAVDNSLKRMKVDFIDVIYCHRYDPETPISEIVQTMDLIIKQGKALYWGTSEWPVTAIDQAYSYAIENSLFPPIVEQPQYNLLHREKVEVEFDKLYSKMKLGLTTWSPLASGQLTGKYLNGIPAESRVAVTNMGWLKEEVENKSQVTRIKKLHNISEDSGISMTHLALGWCLLNTNVSTVILGASRVQQLEENLKVLPLMGKIADLKKELSKI